MKQRLFFGLRPPDACVGQLARAIQHRGEWPQLQGLRWIPPERWHITVHFFGDVDPARVPDIEAACELGLAGTRPIAVRFGETGAFPSPARARVVWLGLRRGAPEIAELARALAEPMRALGFPPEDRPFQAHLTVARLKRPRSVRTLLDELELPPAEATLEHLTLYRSHLGPNPHYEPLRHFPFDKSER